MRAVSQITSVNPDGFAMNFIELARELSVHSARPQLTENFYHDFLSSSSEEKLTAVIVEFIEVAGSEAKTAEKLRHLAGKSGLSSDESQAFETYLARIFTGGAQEKKKSPELDFSRKLQEYEQIIAVLHSELKDSKFLCSNLESKVGSLKQLNSALEERVGELERQASENHDEANRSFIIREQSSREQFVQERIELEQKNQKLERQLGRETEDRISFQAKLHQAEEQLAIANDQLRKLSETHVPKAVLKKLEDEKVELETRVSTLENTAYAEISERTGLQEQIARLKERHDSQREFAEQSHRREIEELRRQLEDSRRANEDLEKKVREVAAAGPSDAGRDARPRESPTPMIFPTILRASELPATNAQMLAQFDDFHAKFDELRQRYDQENELLKNTIKSLKEEVTILRRQHDNSNTLKSMTGLSSRDLSQLKKNDTMADEVIDKLVKMENANKLLKYDNKRLREQLEVVDAKRTEQLNSLYSSIVEFKRYLDH